MTTYFETQTQASLLALSLCSLCMILNGSLQTSDILSKSYTYVENVHVLVHATAVKNMTSFLQAISCLCLNPGQ